MLDVKLIRENPEFVKSNLMKRGNPEIIKMLEELIAVDSGWRRNLTKLNELRHERKLITTEIATLKKLEKTLITKLRRQRPLTQKSQKYRQK